MSVLREMAGNCASMSEPQQLLHTRRYKSSAGGQKTREALLDPKSHRRVSRRQVRRHPLASML